MKIDKNKLELGGPFDGMTIERGYDGRLEVHVVCDVHNQASYYLSFVDEDLLNMWLSMQYESGMDE